MYGLDAVPGTAWAHAFYCLGFLGFRGYGLSCRNGHT